MKALYRILRSIFIQCTSIYIWTIYPWYY